MIGAFLKLSNPANPKCNMGKHNGAAAAIVALGIDLCRRSQKYSRHKNAASIVDRNTYPLPCGMRPISQHGVTRATIEVAPFGKNIL